jgi:hypothetical protein
MNKTNTKPENRGTKNDRETTQKNPGATPGEKPK